MTSNFNILLYKGKEIQRTLRNRSAEADLDGESLGDLCVLLFADLYFLKWHCLIQRNYLFHGKSLCKLGFN